MRCPRLPPLLARPAWRLALLLVLSGPAAAGPLDDTLRPSPDLDPGEVVRIQLEALRANDAEDRGIAVAFRFASPTNRDQTGPLARFAAMLKRGPYALMLNFSEAVYDTPRVRGDEARQRVVLIGALGDSVDSSGYEFHLSRQQAPPYEGCWMTDSVAVVALGGTIAQAGVPSPAGPRWPSGTAIAPQRIGIPFDEVEAQLVQRGAADLRHHRIDLVAE